MEISVTTSIALATIVFFLYKLATRPKSTKKQLPEASRLPIIGHTLHQMVGSLPHRVLKNLADQYGPVMHLQIGELSAIVISSADKAKEVLNTHGVLVADRPQTTVAKIMLYNSLGATFAPYGDYLKQLRQIYALELLSPKTVRSFWTIMEDELSTMVTSVKAEAGQPIVLHDKMLTYLYDTLCRATVGSVCNGRETLIMAARETSALSAAIRIEDLFPSVKILPVISGLKTRLTNLLKQLDTVLEDIIGEREKKMFSSNNQPLTEEEDMLGVLLMYKNGKGKDAKFRITNNDIKAIVWELILAGTLSSAAIVEWCMSEMIKNPRVMKKAQDEVRQVLKDKKTVSGSDLAKLEYVKMVVKESVRLHPPAPLLFPREVREDFEMDGMIIPKKSWVIINYWAVGTDPKTWHDAVKYEPERFSNSSVDFYGSHFELIPFGAGRRICPGILFGTTNVELLLASFLYHFDWKLPGGMKPEELDMNELFGAGCVRENPLCLIPSISVAGN
uniref:Sarpagan bridge enzyme 1 n=1 Tax=Rauvolfia serpentina TaxID=4060 RepID=SBE1_RAUSE|nr:RecName: Full=Sarpagan bridge enzyme; Short=RsSBE; AltName: Full=Cytochrome P450 71AY4 [Rauvolfia serpentina]